MKMNRNVLLLTKILITDHRICFTFFTSASYFKSYLSVRAKVVWQLPGQKKTALCSRTWKAGTWLWYWSTNRPVSSTMTCSDLRTHAGILQSSFLYLCCLWEGRWTPVLIIAWLLPCTLCDIFGQNLWRGQEGREWTWKTQWWLHLCELDRG